MADNLILNANLICKADGFDIKKCAVEKVIEVSEVEFDKFTEKPMDSNYYLTRYKEIMGYYDGAYHGVLFMNLENGDGLFVNSEGYDYARYAQYIPNARALVWAHEQDVGMTETDKSDIVKTKLYCPLVFRVCSDDAYDDPDVVDSANYIDYDYEINAAIRKDLETDEYVAKRGLAAYLHDDDLEQKVLSAMPRVETRNGELYGVITVKSCGELRKVEMIDLVNDLTGQLADGWGEGFEQREVRLGDDEVYISFWNHDDYFLKPEAEVFPEQDINQGMGGLS